MRKLKKLLAILLALLLIFPSMPVGAQNLEFEIPKQNVIVYVNSDGTASLDYTIVFANSARGGLIDIVDIGMPTPEYSLSSMSAEIDGSPVEDIRTSSYIDQGVEIHFGSHAIPSGATGTLHLYVGRVDNALGKSTLEESEPYASIVFTPNYFDGGFVTGKTDYTFSIILPEGIAQDLPRYHTPSNNWPGAEQPTTYYDEQGRVVYTWTAPEANSQTEYQFGASFPMRLVPESVVVATETPNTRSVNLGTLFGLLCTVGFVGLFIGIVYLGNVASKKRKLQYLPPKISVEGHGIKRGLTPVETAVLMETPLDKVMTMILFSTVKKNAATVETRDPLKLTIADPLPAGLQPYEVLFLKAFRNTSDKDRKKDLQDMTINLIKSVTEKMKGFSRKETIDYYTSIMEKAWAQIKAADTPEVKSETFEEVMDWTMLDRRWEDRTRDTFGTGPVILPTWWGRYDPVMRGAGFGPVSTAGTSVSMPSSSSQGGSITLPKLPGADFAASMIGGVQSFSSDVMGNLTSFTGNITNKTNPPPPPSTGTRGGGGGGSSCACACACAGCACACAGGGR